MKRKSMKALVGATAAFALLAVGTAFINGNAEVKASAAPSATITMEGASMRYDTAGLRFGASMSKADFESFIYPEGSEYEADSFEVGMLILPASMLEAGETLEVGNADAMNLTMTWNGTLVDDDLQAAEATAATKVLFKGYVDTVPMANYETGVIGRAYYRSGSEYVYSQAMTKTLLSVAEEAYADENAATKPDDDQKAALYNDHLKPYYLSATNFSITAVADSTTPTVINEYDSANKALTVTMPKDAKNGEGQNAIRTKNTYAPGTYVMMEFKGAEIPGYILFGDTGWTPSGGELDESLSTGDNVFSGVGFWL